MSYLTNPIPTRYSDNNQDSNTVINLMFLRYGSEKLDNHIIYPDWQLSLNHTPLIVTIQIVEEHIYNKKCSIIKGSMKEKSFIKDLIKDIKTINTSNLTDIDSLKNVVNSFAKAIDCYDQYFKDKTWSRAESNNDMIGYAVVVSVSVSCSRYSNLTFSSYTMT